jgi:hypothetical protein
MIFEVVGDDGRTVQVEAVDWMMAMCEAIAVLGIEVSGWLCNSRPDGSTHVADPMSGRSWVVRRIDASDADSAWLGKVRGGPKAPEIASPAIPPASGGLAASPPPPDLAERLFDLSMDLEAAGDPNQACKTALDLLVELMRCEAGSVLRGTLNDFALTFVATAGPTADEILGQKMTYGQGLVRVAFDLSITVQVNDVSNDRRHDRHFDQATGFHTRSVLCTPIRRQRDFYGAIEMINPPGDFAPWHVETVEYVAKSLADVLVRA